MNYYEYKRKVYETAIEIYSSNLVTGTWGNVSHRINSDLFIITPSGMDYNSLESEDMLVVDKDGQVIEGKYKPSIETPMHISIYQARPDVNAIVHVHSPYATAFAVANKAIPVILEETAQVIGHPVEVAAYAICGSEELADEVTQCVSNKEKAVLLANHGLVALEENMEAALKVCFIAEKTAMIAMYASQIGQINVLSKEDILILNEDFKSYGQSK
ncbi:MAG TPA: class II aldolase/adducin family protein [Syntrophomonadaceae bacterium]|nr:class II aldolase/adducin family protein [Syntrophomonadaceae bacterium]